MKGLGILLGTLGASALAISFAFANPGMLPNHPGYPAAGKSPATGQTVANDQGQTNLSGMAALVEAAGSLDAASINNVQDPNRKRIKESMGANILPEVDGPLNRVNINPAGATSTVIK